MRPVAAGPRKAVAEAVAVSAAAVAAAAVAAAVARAVPAVAMEAVVPLMAAVAVVGGTPRHVMLDTFGHSSWPKNQSQSLRYPLRSRSSEQRRMWYFDGMECGTWEIVENTRPKTSVEREKRADSNEREGKRRGTIRWRGLNSAKFFAKAR